MAKNFAKTFLISFILCPVLENLFAVASNITEVRHTRTSRQFQFPAIFKKRLTGGDMYTAERWEVAGTDLGIPYILENLSIGYLFGDTFEVAWPEDNRDPNKWRSPVMLRSAVHPGDPNGIVFDSAAKVFGNGMAPSIMHNGKRGVGIDGIWEFTVIPNDGISFPETRRQLVSYMSVKEWRDNGPPAWDTNYAGLAYSDNGNDFIRTNLKWWNTPDNKDPFQMWTMQRDGDFVYVFSVRAGRQEGPMMLRRVRWDKMFDQGAYEGWGWNGNNWGWGRPPTPILSGCFSEPSVRRLSDGKWVMAYLNCRNGIIVTRTANGPDQVWSGEKIQVVAAVDPGIYGGFIHPWSTSQRSGLHLIVSKWTMETDENGKKRSTAYHVSQYVGSV